MKKLKFWMLALVITLAACTREPAQPTTADTTPVATSGAQTAPEGTTQQTPEPTTTRETVPLDTTPLIPQDRLEGSYEQWLGATAVMGVYMEYPGAQIQQIYAMSTTPFDKKLESQGVTLRILVDGKEIWIRSLPLDAERALGGTRDLHAMGLGFNTFDEVPEVDVSAATVLTLEALTPYVELNVLPMVVFHP